MVKRLIAGTCLTAALASPAFADGPELMIEDFVGRITVVETSSSNIKVTREDNMKGVNLYEDGGSLKIDGGIDDPDGNKCKGYYGKYSISWFKKENSGQMGGYEDLDDYPKLTIEAPTNTALVIRNSIPFMTTENLGSIDADINHCGDVRVGDVSGDVRANIRGSGDLVGGDIGNADITVKGSGDVEFQDAGFVELSISGSGDGEFENVTSADVRISGSGDVSFENINGPLSVDSRGSGDFEAGDVSGDFVYDSRGSSDLELDSVTGRISVEIGGSGDAHIDGGQASELRVSTTGASEFSFDGTADSADLYASGASDIYIAEVTGEVRQKESGSADINVNY